MNLLLLVSVVFGTAPLGMRDDRPRTQTWTTIELGSTYDFQADEVIKLDDNRTPEPAVFTTEVYDPTVGSTTSLATPVTDSEPRRARLKHTVETIDTAALAELSPRIRERVLAQAELDVANDAFTPQLEETFEDVPEFGRIFLGKAIAQADYSIVFTVLDHPELILKYQSNCDGFAHDVHSLLIDFLFGVEAAKLGVAARPRFISPPARMPNYSVRKTAGLAGQAYEDCRTRGGLVRYMLMDNAVRCLDEGGVLSPARAMAVGANLMRSLQTLHRAGIIHGDVHNGNVCMPGSEESNEVVLIDFGRARYIDEETDVRERERFSYIHTHFTPWQLDGRRYSLRDDVFKAVEAVATVLVGPSVWTVAIERSKGRPSGLLRWKEHAFIFQSNDADPIRLSSGLSPRQVARAKSTLQKVLALVRGLHSVNDPIPYTKLISLFESVRDQLLMIPFTERVRRKCCLPTSFGHRLCRCLSR